MDRSFLSHDQIISASRNFVCIRLATYEDEGEAEFLKSIYVNRSGDLENTVFAILSPDTKTDLCRPGRGPHFSYSTPEEMAREMDKIAGRYVKTAAVESPGTSAIPRLPQMKNFRLALNVSSCDGLPLVVAVGEKNSDVKPLTQTLAQLAFAERLAGKFSYVATSKKEDLASVDNYRGQTGILLIEPGEFGTTGRLIQAFAADTPTDTLEESLRLHANATAKVTKHHGSHVQNANRQGLIWETEIPVTDPQSLRATERRESSSGRRGPGR